MEKQEIETETIRCPFCGRGDILITKTSEYYSVRYARASGRVKRIPVIYPERIEIHNKCPFCKKSKKEIKEAFLWFWRVNYRREEKRIAAGFGE